MRKTIINSLVLAVSLLCLLVLGACPPDADTDTGTKVSGEETGEIIIKNIPKKMKEGGPDSFKIYVQLSESTKETDPHTAISSGKIAGDNVVLKLYTEQGMTTPWKGKGSYYIAITISPKTALSKEDILARVPPANLSLSPEPFSSESNTFDWKELKKIPLSSRIEAIYELIIKDDPDITSTPTQ
jgi:hypothetical protein